MGLFRYSVESESFDLCGIHRGRCARGRGQTKGVEWGAADLCYQGHKIEVKSSVDCQSWHQEEPSTIRFGVGKAVERNPATGKDVGEPIRCADVYVFCHYPERERAKANVLDVPAWNFDVISTETLNRDFGKGEVAVVGGGSASRSAVQVRWTEGNRGPDSEFARRVCLNRSTTWARESKVLPSHADVC